MNAAGPSSKWMNLAQMSVYMQRGKRFVSREVRAGRLRAARIGGKGEIFGTAEWCDDYMVSQSKPIEIFRRRAS